MWMIVRSVEIGGVGGRFWAPRNAQAGCLEVFCLTAERDENEVA